MHNNKKNFFKYVIYLIIVKNNSLFKFMNKMRIMDMFARLYKQGSWQLEMRIMDIFTIFKKKSYSIIYFIK